MDGQILEWVVPTPGQASCNLSVYSQPTHCVAILICTLRGYRCAYMVMPTRAATHCSGSMGFSMGKVARQQPE